jgi:peptidoglycan/LPS O-acetylase OafA/YrhL
VSDVTDVRGTEQRAVATDRRQATRTRIEGLDAIRGGAVLLVLVRHAWPDVFGGAGVVGVTAFFALSGYLITGMIADEVSRTGRLSYARFTAGVRSVCCPRCS